jgi:Sulfotransferase family
VKGPYPIVCRGHSGSRLLCEAFMVNRMWMGLTTQKEKDTTGFGQGNAAVRRMIRGGFRFGDLQEDERSELQDALRNLTRSVYESCPDPHTTVAYGWKRPIMAFAVELILETYQDAKVVHLIRDGRDVMLSRLNWRMNHLQDRVNRLTVFGDDRVTSYAGKPFTPENVDEHRNELEMIHWVTSVTAAMKGRRFAGRYMEVRYEDLCTDPLSTLEKVFGFLDVPFRDETRHWIVGHASSRAIGKWRGKEGELAPAIAIGQPLLKELGYIA